MYKLAAKKRIRKKIEFYINQRRAISEKLERLKNNPRKACGAHPLHGDLKGKWACWLGSNIRMTYSINDQNKIIIAYSIGTHNIYLF